jgi:hypothetical protein
LKLYIAIVFMSISFCFMGCNRPDQDIVGQSADLQFNKSKKSSVPGTPEMLVSGLMGASGSAIGPGGDLFVTEGAVGELTRIDLKTRDESTFAYGFPPSLVGIGGAYDVAFIDGIAYVLVTLVDDPNLFPTGEVNGIYRVNGPDSYTIIADIGAFNLDNPPSGFNYFISTGVQYSIQTYRGGFLVADGHFNRILHITVDGEISIFKSFGNIVPTGLDVSGNTIFMAEAGPIPHNPEDGKVVAFSTNSPSVSTLASGARLLVDVEFGRGQTLFGLSQGEWNGDGEGSSAIENDGALLRVNEDGTFATIFHGLDRPTSLEIKKNTAYIITLDGEVWAINNIAGPPFGF